MTPMTARRLLVLAAAPLLMTAALSPSVVGQQSASVTVATGEPMLHLAVLTSEARPLAVHIDGP
jgi:hypothetical protein